MGMRVAKAPLIRLWHLLPIAVMLRWGGGYSIDQSRKIVSWVAFSPREGRSCRKRMRGSYSLTVMFALLITVSTYAKSTFPLDQYIARLQDLHTSIATKQFAAAKAVSAELTGSDIVSARGNFHADDSLLAAVAQTSSADRVLLTRIELTIAELRTAEASDIAPDPKLLQQVAAEQDVPELARGGEVAAPVSPEVPLIERVIGSIGRMFAWIWEKLVQLYEWVEGFFPRRSDESGATSGMRWIVIIVVALIVMAIIFLAVEVVRRARRGDPQTLTSSAPLRSARDDDPLSRGATEWERYAAQLGAESRYREAIRAWYHAVLVTCYGTGVLHFRKSRTNWEYIASLPPSTAWRSELIRLTQRFEQEWYGAEQSTEDMLDDCSTRAKRILDAVHRVASERGAA